MMTILKTITSDLNEVYNHSQAQQSDNPTLSVGTFTHFATLLSLIAYYSIGR